MLKSTLIFDINICGVWCCYNWLVGFLVKLLPVLEKNFQPNFNICCGEPKKKKLKEIERLDGIDNSPHEIVQTNGQPSCGFIALVIVR